MSNGNFATIDKAGRLVIPKAVREQAALRSGDRFEILLRHGSIEIVPLPRAVRIVRQGYIATARPIAADAPLTEALVEQTLDQIRAGKA